MLKGISFPSFSLAGPGLYHDGRGGWLQEGVHAQRGCGDSCMRGNDDLLEAFFEYDPWYARGKDRSL